ncbi:uncharacterized protein LOC111251359 isoform X2 [Varroa destructor]|nr:uncharacterized protein LOC111251359 isoform X2 [Varroa destructor]XP_022663598.1 uncharacterized protein LOC111251359 isoform X2 [Varroa destructor]XP_022663599.1 uncharacterized protein LOC111251359 isoform X2 [Varroa destructor]
MAEAADSQTTLSNGSSAISLSSPSPIKHKPQYNADQAVVTYESEGACVNCCIVFFYVVGMVLIAVGIGATAMITQYPEHVLYLAMTGASGIILGLIFVSLSATICSPRRRRVVDAKSDVNGNAGNQQNGKAGPRLPLGSTLGAHGGTHGLPSTNRYEVRAGGSADVIDDNLVLSSSPKMHQQPSSETTNTAAAYQSTNDSRSAQKPLAPIQLKFARKSGSPQPTTIGDYTISAHHPTYGTLPPAYMTLSGRGHVTHIGAHSHAVGSHQYPADISAHSLANNYTLDAAGGGANSGVSMVMAPMVSGNTHPSDEVHGGMMIVGHSSLRSPNMHSTATLPLPTRMRSSLTYNDVLLEEPRRVGIHILRQREASSSDGLESNGSEDPGLRVPHGQMGAGHAMGGHSQTPTPPSDPEQMQQQGRVQQQASHSQQGGGLASVRELQTHNSTSSDERSSPRSDYFSKESSIASTEHRQTLTMSTASHQITHGMQSMNTVGLPQANARKKPSEIAAKPFMIPNVANLRPVIPQVVQPSYYSRMAHDMQGFHPVESGQPSGGQDTSYASIDHGVGVLAAPTGAMVHQVNVVALSDEDASRNNDLLETQI